MTDITAITMPKWGLTMTEGKVIGWLKQAGDTVAAGDELLEIETSKITNVFEAPEAGTLRRVVAPEGTMLPIGGLLAIVAPDSVPDSDIDAFVASFKAPEPAAAEDVGEAAAPRDIDAGGKRLRVLDLGGGDAVPVLLIHGFGADLNTWMFNQPALAERHRTIAFDLPGHGGSVKQLDKAIDGAGFAALLDGALAALGIDRAHLVGHSLGGGIALHFAARHPQRVASMTLISSACLGEEINADFIAGFIKMERRRDAQEVLRLLVHNAEQVSRAMVEEVLRYKRVDGVPAALTAIAAEWFPNGWQPIRPELEAVIPRPPMPTQVIWGREDRIIPVTNAEALECTVHILDAAGHLPHMEKAGEVNRLIAEFIAATG